MREDLPLFEALERGAFSNAVQASTALSRRLRVLLHVEPLFRLRAADGRRDEDLRHYDTLQLALRILDLIAEHMGLDQAATADTLFYGVRDVLAAMDELALVEPSPARHRRIFDRVLGALRNENDGYRPFRIEWADVDSPAEPKTRVLSFRLVEDAFGLDGAPVLRLSPTAINLVFSALDMDIEDAQTATEAIVQSQIRRGRFGHAAQSARNALNQSMLYQQRLRRILQWTRRDIHRVDWVVEVPTLLDDALVHLDERLSVESTIRESAHSRLDHLQPGSEEAQQVARIAELVGRCIDHHTLLQRDLLEARAAFLDAQARQAFVPRRRRIVKSLYYDALQPLLAEPARDVETQLSAWLPIVRGGRAPRSFNLRDMIDGLLSPRQERRPQFLRANDDADFDVEVEQRYFSDADRARVWTHIEQAEGPLAWGDFLDTDDLNDRQRHLLAIESLAWTDPEEGRQPPMYWGDSLRQRRRIKNLWIDDFELETEAPMSTDEARPDATKENS